MKRNRLFLFFGALFVLSGLFFAEHLRTSAADTSQLPIQFANIGDFGSDDANEAAVATLVTGWNPEFIFTNGDNLYGAALKFDGTVGGYYCDFLADVTPDTGAPQCNGGNSATNRFFPAPGNHDYLDGPVINGLGDYTAYFDLPGAGIPSSNTSGSELYYDVIQGSVHFFFLDSQTIDVAGGAGSAPYNTQRAWLETQLGLSTAPWKVVVAHHPPYSSSSHGSQGWMQWPYAAWGADVVFASHDHIYERVHQDGIVYFVNGLGGGSIYPIGAPIAGSQARYNAARGAMKISADAGNMTFQFINVSGTVIDSHSLAASPTSVQLSTSQTASASVNYLWIVLLFVGLVGLVWGMKRKLR